MIRDSGALEPAASRYDAAHAERVIAELEAQYAAGDIERHAYLEKKRGLVRLFVKATTQPRRRAARSENYDGE
ncbi:hypothetical protein [Leucobacter massiliensis]|uniref:Uncharacterized protein n=1 Tax=Leucobacter massiliensis TaxID=1686285 RepID=A0A2S9QNS1_9MICO|nr:hypothetical protein [Leucobacter massiliensis]PRI11224.1 hypothetical protein B4915_10265 [Leucobacter massiliensis]